MTALLVIVAVGLGSYLFRAVPLIALQHATLPARADRVIRHAGVAAIAAVVASSTQQAATGGAAPTFAAVAAGGALAARGSSMIRIVCLGVAIYAVASVVGDAIA